MGAEVMATDCEFLGILQTASKRVNKVLAAGKGLTKAFDKIKSEQELSRQDYLIEALEAIQNTPMSFFGCGDMAAEISHGLEERIRILRINARGNLIRDLSERVSKPEHFRMLCDSPLAFYLHPLTLDVDLDHYKATLCYAREPLVTTTLAPEEIMSAHAGLVDFFRQIRIDSQGFLKVCHLAYEMVLLKNGLPKGSRIDIIELLDPLSWLWPQRAKFKKGSGMPKFLLAYQLQKVRQDNLLSHNGMRIDLGTATGGSTKNKANVLYIPAGVTEGQYYLSICFRQT